MTGRKNEIRKCLSCNDGCYGYLFPSGELRCAINPELGKEFMLDQMKVPALDKKLLVVGGGPAGCLAAITASKRGVDVTLVEKTDRIGGQLNIASIPPYKNRIQDYSDWLSDELKRCRVDVILETEVNSNFVKRLNPDSVLIASGSIPFVANIPGVENGINSWEILDGRAEMPKNETIAIIGGGIVGSETAHLLQENGNKVIIFELLSELANGLETLTRIDLMTDLTENGAIIKTDARVNSIEKNQVTYSSKAEGENQIVTVDKIVLSMGQVINRNNLKEAIEDELGIEARYIGDSASVGKIITAVQQGYYAGADVFTC